MFVRVTTGCGKQIITVDAFSRHFGFAPPKKRWVTKPRKFTLRDCDLFKTFLQHRIEYHVSPDFMEFKVSYRHDSHTSQNN